MTMAGVAVFASRLAGTALALHVMSLVHAKTQKFGGCT